jgi:hypothetical protein
MVGVLPKTKLLVIRNNYILAHCSYWREVIPIIGVTITPDGQIFAGKFFPRAQLPVYLVRENGKDNAFTPEKAMVDWLVYHSSDYLRTTGVVIYRYLAQ